MFTWNFVMNFVMYGSTLRAHSFSHHSTHLEFRDVRQHCGCDGGMVEVQALQMGQQRERPYASVAHVHILRAPVCWLDGRAVGC